MFRDNIIALFPSNHRISNTSIVDGNEKSDITLKKYAKKVNWEEKNEYLQHTEF